MPLRVVEQHVRVVACRCQISVPQRDRTRRAVQSITERDRMLCRPRIVNAVFGFAHRAIGKALQPKDSRKMDAGRDLRVELQANELPFVAGRSGLSERPFNIASRALLITEVVVRDADHPLANKSIVRVGARRHQGSEPVRQGQSGAIIDTVDMKGPQAPERAHLVLRYRRGSPPAPGPSSRPKPPRERRLWYRVERRPRRQEASSPGEHPLGEACQCSERLLDAAAAFLQQRQLHPCRHRSGSQCDADLRIAIG